jgi:hypothetical protein
MRDLERRTAGNVRFQYLAGLYACYAAQSKLSVGCKEGSTGSNQAPAPSDVGRPACLFDTYN